MSEYINLFDLVEGVNNKNHVIVRVLRKWKHYGDHAGLELVLLDDQDTSIQASTDFMMMNRLDRRFEEGATSYLILQFFSGSLELSALSSSRRTSVTPVQDLFSGARPIKLADLLTPFHSPMLFLFHVIDCFMYYPDLKCEAKTKY